MIGNECPFINDRVTTISGHFFAICMFIFHKTEVQTVILRCSTCLNLNWFKIYGLRCNMKPRASLVNSPKIATDKWPFCDRIWPFFANHMIIFHKTEIQTVILMCLMSLNLNWYKSYDTKRKNSESQFVFWNKIAKKGKWKYFHFVL